MKREYRHNNFGISKDFSVEIGKKEISVTEFNGCAIEEFIDIPREVFRKIYYLLIKTELLEEIELIRDRLDAEELNKAEVIIAQLNSDKTSASDLARIEDEINELSTEF